jgi:hypothetical protein
MDSALFIAQTEVSTPQQFLLSWVDFKAFVAGNHPDKTNRGSKPDWFYKRVSVVQASDETTPSVLHVIGSRPIFTNPITL